MVEKLAAGSAAQVGFYRIEGVEERRQPGVAGKVGGRGEEESEEYEGVEKVDHFGGWWGWFRRVWERV